MKRSTAGKSRKTHKSLKTEPSRTPAGGPSSTALTTALLTPPALSPQAYSPHDPQAEPTTVPVEKPEDQWWWRPRDSKARKVAEKIMVMRAAGHDDKAIAKRLKSTEGSIRQYVYLARKNGWLDDNDEPVDLELDLALNVDRKIVRNIGASLDGQMTNWQTHEMTIAAAKGRGVFKNHEVSKNEGGVSMAVVAIQVVMPPVGAGDQMPEINEEQMGGRAAYVEGDVDDSSDGPEGRLALGAAADTH